MLELISEHGCFGGVQRFYRHDSKVIGLPMRVGVYLPPQASFGKVPALFSLAGLTCNEETFAFKAGAQRYAAEQGLALVTPDTSPRGDQVPDEPESWDFGIGAGCYVDATQEPWPPRYRMYSNVLNELPYLIAEELPVDGERLGISGHSMGGHGALVRTLRNRNVFKSVLAFAPIAAPSQCPWGNKAFGRYLGPGRDTWAEYDASELVLSRNRPLKNAILIDQGLADPFLAEQLNPEAFAMACAHVGQALNLRRHQTYDHDYHFISSFIGDHIAFHRDFLR